MFSTGKGSEAQHCTAFSGMEVVGGGALGMGAESSRKVPGNGGGAEAGYEGCVPCCGASARHRLSLPLPWSIRPNVFLGLISFPLDHPYQSVHSNLGEGYSLLFRPSQITYFPGFPLPSKIKIKIK